MIIVNIINEKVMRISIIHLYSLIQDYWNDWNVINLPYMNYSVLITRDGDFSRTEYSMIFLFKKQNTSTHYLYFTRSYPYVLNSSLCSESDRTAYA